MDFTTAVDKEKARLLAEIGRADRRNDNEFDDGGESSRLLERREALLLTLPADIRDEVCREDTIDKVSRRYAYGQARGFLDGFGEPGAPVSLLMNGPQGTGKTLAASLLALDIFEGHRRRLPKVPFVRPNGKREEYSYEATLRHAMAPEDADALIDDLTRYQLRYVSARRIGTDVADSFRNQEAANRLESDGEWAKSAKCIFILDDLGREKDTEATAGRLASMIAARYERRATTIITSNLSLEAIGAKYGRDIQSRLLDRRWITIVPIRAEDARLRAPNVQSEKRLTVCA